ncbi:MAG: rhomboid family intramembrane serine protease, partial [Bdellovibrionota bacterium]
MIFPVPEDFKGLEKSPITHLLLALNIIVFFVFFWTHSLEKGPAILENERFMSETKKYYLEWYLFKYDEVLVNSESEKTVYRALTDPEFIDDLEVWNSSNDPIAFNRWRHKAIEWRNTFTSTPLSQFGLKAHGGFSLQWITYQFSHSDLFHLLSNICFLFVLGLWIERYAGSMFLLVL